MVGKRHRPLVGRDHMSAAGERGPDVADCRFAALDVQRRRLDDHEASCPRAPLARLHRRLG